MRLALKILLFLSFIGGLSGLVYLVCICPTEALWCLSAMALILVIYYFWLAANVIINENFFK